MKPWEHPSVARLSKDELEDRLALALDRKNIERYEGALREISRVTTDWRARRISASALDGSRPTGQEGRG